MRTLLSFVLLALCIRNAVQQHCSTCDQGIAAVSITGTTARFRDNVTDALSVLAQLTVPGLGFTAINSTEACNNHNVCGSDSTCAIVTTDVFNCTCDQHFTPNAADTSFQCVDINECNDATLHNCSANATCTNLSPEFSCACNTGFSGDGVNCTDIQECSPNPCVTNATCAEPVPGNHTCTCITGYAGDAYNGSCTDIDECTSSTHNCATNASCTNQDPGFSCACDLGFTGDGVNCTDIQECASNPCAANAICDEPRADNYTCTCNTGFSGDGYNSCVRARQEIEITFFITCLNLNFDGDLQNTSSDLYANVTNALRSAIQTFITSVDSPSGIANATFSFTNSTDGLGSAEASVILAINNTDQLPEDFLKRVSQITETVECNVVASTDECAVGIHVCSGSQRCADSVYGHCCYSDIEYTASIALNATFNATIHNDITSSEAQNICDEVQNLVQRLLDAKQTRGCSQNITFDCRKLLSGSVESVLHLSIANATYDVKDIAAELQKAVNSSTSFGTVLRAGDFDECSDQYETERNCSAFATCLNFAGSFSCDCNATYYDNGTTTGKICIVPVTTTCGGSNITISILSDYYTRQGINLTSLRLADENCNYTTHANVVGDSVEFVVNFNECNTTIGTLSDNVTVVAQNFITNLPTSGSFTGVEVNLPYQCELPGFLNITSQFQGVVRQVVLPDVVSTGGFNLDFSMFDSTFQTKFGASKTFFSNEIIYGQISISNPIDDVSVKMDRCWGTPTPDRTSSESLEYITNGCSNGQATNFNLVSNGLGSARFSFQMFFFTQVNSVYLHCEVQVCTPSCASTCPSKRRRRQAIERTEEVTIAILIKLDKNDPLFNNFNNGNGSIIGIVNPDDATSTTRSISNDITLPIVCAILAFLLIILVALLVIFAVRRRRASKEVYDMTHVNTHTIGVKPPNYY